MVLASREPSELHVATIEEPARDQVFGRGRRGTLIASLSRRTSSVCATHVFAAACSRCPVSAATPETSTVRTVGGRGADARRRARERASGRRCTRPARPHPVSTHRREPPFPPFAPPPSSERALRRWELQGLPEGAGCRVPPPGCAAVRRYPGNQPTSGPWLENQTTEGITICFESRWHRDLQSARPARLDALSGWWLGNRTTEA